MSLILFPSVYDGKGRKLRSFLSVLPAFVGDCDVFGLAVSSTGVVQVLHHVMKDPATGSSQVWSLRLILKKLLKATEEKPSFSMKGALSKAIN